MVNQWMLELSDPIDCEVRDHGEGSIRVLVWGSLNANPQCWVRLYGSGKMLVVDQSDLRTHGNPGDERDLGGPHIPSHWRRWHKAECTSCGHAFQYERVADLKGGSHDSMCAKCGHITVLASNGKYHQ